ncbi:hypothetical protein M9Y10_017969 [Tritrichomonas musculus]|uniref:Protein kinase domain-containing protein n=1 Tax=Tritrichomonas musculus TaxID=1915356 RepID=A0ABR2HWQ6_9EUKA
MIQSKTQNGYPINIPTMFNKYKYIKQLGCGSTCAVFKVEDQFSHVKFSAKILPKKDIEERNLMESIINEVNILRSIDHSNIIKVYDAFEMKNEYEEEYLVIIMEYCSKGNLLNYARNHGFKTDGEKKKIIEGFLEAIQYLHEYKISHGDIKLENILLDESYSPKLCDFGYSRVNQIAGDESKNGTLFYAAPELFIKGQFDTLKTDIYAIGITLYTLSELQLPFKMGNKKSIVNQILSGHLSFKKGIDRHLTKLIEKCTSRNPQNRPTISDIINDEYFTCEKNNQENILSTLKFKLQPQH